MKDQKSELSNDRPEAQADASEWNLPAGRSKMSSGTKIGLLLVLVLCGLGGYFLYQKLQAHSELNTGEVADADSKGDVADDTDSKTDDERTRHRRGHDDESSETDGEVTLTAAQVAEKDGKTHRNHNKSTASSDFNFDDESAGTASTVGEGQTEPESDDPFESANKPEKLEHSRDGEHNRHKRSSQQSSNPILTLDDEDENTSNVYGQESPAADELATDSEGSSTVEKSDDSESPFYKSSKNSGRRHRPLDDANELDTTELTADEDGERPQILPGPRGQHDSQRNSSPVRHKGFDHDNSDALASLDEEAETDFKSERPNHQGNWNGESENVAKDQPVPEEIDDFSPDSPPRNSMSSQRQEHHLNDFDDTELDADAAEVQVYVVQESDNFWTIAKNVYGAASYFNALAEFNKERIPDPQKMRPGMKVLVPPAEVLDRKYPTLVAKKNSPQSAESVHQSGFNASGDGANGGEIQPAGFFVGPQGRPSYRIGKEDTLSSIAKSHLGRASRWSQIYQLNRQLLPTPHSLQVGMVLELPADACSVVLVNEGTSTR